jgi:hypothetical protein
MNRQKYTTLAITIVGVIFALAILYGVFVFLNHVPKGIADR